MIITKEVRIELNQFNYHHYKRIGYDTDNKDFIMVDINDIGCRTQFKIDVKCDLCGNEKRISYRKYSDNISTYNIYTCSNKCAMFKNENTNLERYGHTHQCRNENIKDKIYSTKLEKGLITEDVNDYLDYRRIVNNLTNRVKKRLFEEWDGNDYYDNDYIKDNMNLNFNNVNYPTIDHKVSAFEGYKNGKTPEEISSIENLCITKRKNNSSKSTSSEKDYKIKKEA